MILLTDLLVNVSLLNINEKTDSSVFNCRILCCFPLHRYLGLKINSESRLNLIQILNRVNG